MFQRRQKRTVSAKVWEFVWPRMGWRRQLQYYARRVARLPGSVSSLASGIAFGVAVSFTPFVGLHIVLSVFLSWITRSNIIASIIGTAVGNPWTFPLIWVWIYNLGGWLGVGSSDGSTTPQNFHRLFSHMMTSLLKLDLAYLSESAWPIFGPMLAGSIPTATAAWLVTYFAMKPVIRSFRNTHFARRAAAKRAAQERTSA